MPLWLWGADAIALILLVAACLVGLLVARRRVVGRGRGTFDLSVNRQTEPAARGWVLGLASYRRDELYWYRTFSFAWWPRYRFNRKDLDVITRREPVGSEVYALDDGDVIVSVGHKSGVRQMAMSGSALTGLLAWLESKPPGQDVNNVL